MSADDGLAAAADAYDAAPLPASSTPWRRARYAVIDLELTGPDPARDEIVSYASVPIEEGRVKLAGARHGTVRPRRMPDSDTIRIHGLREADLEDAPALDEALADLLQALAGRVLVAHATPIESAFLGAALEVQGIGLRNPVVDTALLAVELSRLRREPPPAEDDDSPQLAVVSSPGLGDLARWLGLPVHRPHHADGDALTTAQAFLALATHLERFRPLDVGALVRMSRPPRKRVSLGSLLGRFGLERFGR